MCTAPNQCTCFENYTKDAGNSSLCVPICSEECINGFCSEPNVCACHSGYEVKNKSQSNICQPICEKLCINAECTAPDVCTCREGYKKERSYGSPKENEETACKPVCNNTCVHGYCIAPNTCSCRTGYKKDSNGECKPVCRRCTNGDCIAPNVCECHPGYRLNKQTDFCIPVCKEGCVNADCTHPNKCTCHEGFVRDERLKHWCLPNCPGGCLNGNCTINKTCDECFDGWEGTNCNLRSAPLFDDPGVGRVEANLGFWFMERSNLFWVVLVALLVVSFIILPIMSKIATDCNRKADNRDSNNVEYVRNAGE
ncbi:hypothetical protein C0J52_09339 [Blattella germanica]|nr:hypothetical protein C0J52_09339 [Blattella germanica]